LDPADARSPQTYATRGSALGQAGVLRFEGNPHQDFRSIFTAKVAREFEDVCNADVAHRRDSILAFARAHGPLRVGKGDLLIFPIEEPIETWYEVTEIYRAVTEHMRMARLYIAARSDHEHARRYFLEKIDRSRASGWVLPAGNAMHHRPFPAHLDEFITRVPDFMAETITNCLNWGNEGGGVPFRVAVDPHRRRLLVEPATLEAALLFNLARHLFLPATTGRERICEYDHEAFPATRKNRRFCDARCRVAFHRQHRTAAG
jgi:hypothetical protein